MLEQKQEKSSFQQIKWICDWLPPINLYNLPEWRYNNSMSDGMSDWMREHQQRAPNSNHYQQVNPEPIEVIEGWNLNFNLGNVLKYIGRYKFKGQAKSDLEKALWYLEREVNKL